MLSRLVAPAGTTLVHGPTLLPEGGFGLESVRTELLAKVTSLSRETPALLLRAGFARAALRALGLTGHGVVFARL